MTRLVDITLGGLVASCLIIPVVISPWWLVFYAFAAALIGYGQLRDRTV